MSNMSVPGTPQTKQDSTIINEKVKNDYYNLNRSDRDWKGERNSWYFKKSIC